MLVRGLVVGLGHPDRGDDAVGSLVADEVASRRPDLAVRHLLDPLTLLDLLLGVDGAVVVDAAVSQAPLGTIEVFDVAAHPLPVRPASPRSTHGMSLATVLDLARATHALPASMWVVSVSAGAFDAGSAPHRAVRAAVPRAAQRAIELLSRAGSG